MDDGQHITIPLGVRLILATKNAGKVRELRQILSAECDDIEMDFDTAIVGSADLVGLEDVVESATTFEGNAVLKAQAAVAATGIPAIADDSGLEVEVLGRSPGIFSARWAGRHGDDEANLQLLLDQLNDVPDEHRAARFVCAAALVTPDGGDPVVCRGELDGTLLRAPRGDGGFGYDPIVQPTGYTQSCAELSADQKNAISHRGQAFRCLAPHVVQVLTA